MAYSLARFNTGGQHLSFWVLSQRFLPPIAVVLPVFLLYINRFQVEPEERILAGLFAGEFDAYRRSVRRWL